MRAQGGGTFESRTDAASSDLYFHYYGLIQHQCGLPNLLDTSRAQRVLQWIDGSAELTICPVQYRQNMLQDMIRTGVLHATHMCNKTLVEHATGVNTAARLLSRHVLRGHHGQRRGLSGQGGDGRGRWQRHPLPICRTGGLSFALAPVKASSLQET